MLYWFYHDPVMPQKPRLQKRQPRCRRTNPVASKLSHWVMNDRAVFYIKQKAKTTVSSSYKTHKTWYPNLFVKPDLTSSSRSYRAFCVAQTIYWLVTWWLAQKLPSLRCREPSEMINIGTAWQRNMVIWRRPQLTVCWPGACSRALCHLSIWAFGGTWSSLGPKMTHKRGSWKAAETTTHWRNSSICTRSTWPRQIGWCGSCVRLFPVIDW